MRNHEKSHSGALFSKDQIISHKHSGAKTLFLLHFIKTGIVDKEFGKLFGDLFDLRQKGDYDLRYAQGRHAQQPAIKIMHRDRFLAPIKLVPPTCGAGRDATRPDAASGNTTFPYCQAVMAKRGEISMKS